MAKLITLFTMLATLTLIPAAQAHFLWLERDGDGPARAYFGEWIDDIREKTGGLLDRFKAPRVTVGASNEPLQVKRNDNNLEFAAKGAGDVRFVDSSVPAARGQRKRRRNQDNLLRQAWAFGNRGEARLGVSARRSQR